MIQIIKSHKTHAQTLKDNIARLNQDQVRQDLSIVSSDIQHKGDEALLHYLEKWDHINPATFSLKVTPKDIQDAYTHVSKDQLTALKNAKANIEWYHAHQLPKNWEKTKSDGTILGQKYTPIPCVGLYVPGGRAVYPSTVLMNAIPAKLAGVQKTVMVTPPNQEGQISPFILVAADLCGVDDIYKVGGAQSVFGLAYGTQTLPKVDKIVGPGNIYVTIAKQMVYGLVDIDKPAGPSEALIYIEDKKYAKYAAAELLAQLEHDPLASAYVISPNEDTLQEIQAQLPRLFASCSRKEIIAQSLKNSALIHTTSRQDSLTQINEIASEHLVLLIDDYSEWLAHIQHAGSIFCGPYSPVAIGDYYAGPNHVLPTDGAARFSSPLGVMDFMKYSSYVCYSKHALKTASKDIAHLTQIEGFDAHYQTIQVRIDPS
jgi:histidinol dehydrogenase